MVVDELDNLAKQTNINHLCSKWFGNVLGLRATLSHDQGRNAKHMNADETYVHKKC